MLQPIELSEIRFRAIGAIDVEDFAGIIPEPKNPRTFPCATLAFQNKELVPGEIFFKLRGHFFVKFLNITEFLLFTPNLLINLVDGELNDGQLKLAIKVFDVLLIVSKIVATVDVLLFFPAFPWEGQDGGRITLNQNQRKIQITQTRY